MRRALLAPCLTVAIVAVATDVRGRDPTAIPGIVDAATVAPGVLVDLKYASTDNFMRRNLYGDLRRCYLRREAAAQLAAAARQLRAVRPDLRLLIYDCARPLRVQRLMWNMVKGTPSQPYVADPKKGSMHNYGCAVDLTLADRLGKPLEMGSAFDSSTQRSQPRLERMQRLASQLSTQHWANRLLLRWVMVQSGFIPLDIEWWHFDCAAPVAARRWSKIP
jgi:zinc D-Ala-D-Ala dipeptidase